MAGSQAKKGTALMGMAIQLEDHQGKVLEEIPDLGRLLARLFPSWGDETFHCLRYIDPWGDTIFNHLQMEKVISELRRIRAKTTVEAGRAFIDAIEGMATRCKEGEHLYLKFLGD
jgi:hypothetical protein